MNEQERNDLLDRKLKREYDKMRMDMEHDLSKRYHWTAQKWFCGSTAIAAILAISLNAYVSYIR